MSSPRRRVLAGAGAVLAAIALSACSDNSIADEAKQGDQKGYIAGDGKTELIPVARRGEPVALAGTTLDGASWESTSQRDKLLVVNVWASWCGPCDKEAPDLVAVSSDPAITASLRSLGRAAVPTYAIYRPGQSANPQVLTELLTIEQIRRALQNG